MRASMVAAWALSLLLVIAVKATEYDYAAHVMLNDGMLDAGMFCTDAELNLIAQAVLREPPEPTAAAETVPSLPSNDDDNTIQLTDDDTRRHLQDAASTASSSSTAVHRSLKRCGCKYCFFATPGCGGLADRRQVRRNRNLRALDATTNEQTCDLEIQRINRTLNELQESTLSSNCSALVYAPYRTYSCRPIVPCAIDTVSVWDAWNERVLYAQYPAINGPTLCSHNKLSFQATTHFALGSVTFALTQHTANTNITTTTIEYNAPYFMHGNSGYHDVYGQYFDAGNYTLVISADDDDEDTATSSSRKTIAFTVTDDCPDTNDATPLPPLP